MHILLAIDGSCFTRKMLAYVSSNELWFRHDFKYTLLHVTAKATGPMYTEAGRVINEAANDLARHFGTSPVRAMRVGKPAEVITDFARREQCNVIVMGTDGYNSLRSVMLGSVTQAVLSSSHVPVLVVR